MKIIGVLKLMYVGNQYRAGFQYIHMYSFYFQENRISYNQQEYRYQIVLKI